MSAETQKIPPFVSDGYDDPEPVIGVYATGWPYQGWWRMYLSEAKRIIESIDDLIKADLDENGPEDHSIKELSTPVVGDSAGAFPLLCKFQIQDGKVTSPIAIDWTYHASHYKGSLAEADLRKFVQKES